ncbi:Methyltransferase [Flavobacterium sp. 9AF]|uniref:methyltransferase n=1 Tax=Flavobacterium sp. 9AF TaxID=2653142 RepID=UPI0012F097B4|nr:methyltransferase [Flavobacterium sp. 9AF]VXB18185.1 Methyltransferase [Flavobacterium sp. 9AF]
MRKFIKKITHPFLKYALKVYYHKPRKYCYDSICVQVHPKVFPPHLTFSTKILLDFIQPLDLKDKTFLELGCGSGIIALIAAKKGALVTATDINQTALNYLDKNAKKNNLTVEITYSDLFDSITKHSFDYIIINPPYYPKKPKNIKENAWFCGENFEYFEKLFHQLRNRNNLQNIFMILSEDCDLKKIKSIASKNNFTFHLVESKTVFKEKNYIYLIN